MAKSTQRSKAWLLVGIEAKLLELRAPFSVGITQALDIEEAQRGSEFRCAPAVAA
jgi:hypothetical protein